MKQANKFGIVIAAGLILTVIALFFMSGMGETTPEPADIRDEYDCGAWIGYQCMDPESQWYGCNVQERVCYAYCQAGGV